MATLSFKLKDVKLLAEHTKSSVSRRPTYDQQLDPNFAKDGTPKMSEDQMFASGSKHVDLKKIPAGFWLVKDSAIFLMSNGTPGLKDGEKPNKIVFAKGYDPNIDEDVWERCCDILGGDDFVTFIPLEWFEISEKDGKRTFSLRVTPRSISLVRR